VSEEISVGCNKVIPVHSFASYRLDVRFTLKLLFQLCIPNAKILYYCKPASY
jgi:hypothetical protein